MQIPVVRGAHRPEKRFYKSWKNTPKTLQAPDRTGSALNVIRNDRFSRELLAGEIPIF